MSPTPTYALTRLVAATESARACSRTYPAIYNDKASAGFPAFKELSAISSILSTDISDTFPKRLSAGSYAETEAASDNCDWARIDIAANKVIICFNMPNSHNCPHWGVKYKCHKVFSTVALGKSGTDGIRRQVGHSPAIRLIGRRCDWLMDGQDYLAPVREPLSSG